MKEFPLTFDTVQHGEESSREVANREELITLRSELELLVLSRAGQSRLACIALSNSASFDDPETPKEFHSILVDALHPRVAKTIEQIDRDFPDVIGEVCRDVIETEAAAFHKDVAACLEKSKSSRAKELSKTYALSVGLTPPIQDEVAQPLDESENTMSEESNVPTSANKEEVSNEVPTESADEQAAQPIAQDASEDFEIGDVDGFDDVDEALNAMESDLQELQALAGSDLEAPAHEPEDVESVGDEAVDQAQVDAVEDAVAVDEESFETDAPDDAVLEAAADELQETVAAEEIASVDDEPASTDAATSASANTDAVEEMVAQEETAPTESDSTIEAATEDVVEDTLADESGSAATPAPSTSFDAGDDLDEDALAASLVAFNEAIADVDIETPTAANQAAPQPSASAPSSAVQASADTPEPPARPAYEPSKSSYKPAATRNPSRRSPASNVEISIGNFADFLLNEVNGMWAEARQGLDEICTVRDEIMAIRAEVSRIHEEIRTMRNSVMTARQDIRGVQSQIQNQRDDANRARQRADSAALDAQAACDRAAAAAREAESMAALCQPR